MLQAFTVDGVSTVQLSRSVRLKCEEGRVGPHIQGAFHDGRCGVDFFLHVVCRQNLGIRAESEDGDPAVTGDAEQFTVGDQRGSVVSSAAARSHLVDAFAGLEFEAGQDAAVLYQVDIGAICERGGHLRDATFFEYANFMIFDDAFAVDLYGQQAVGFVSRAKPFDTSNLLRPLVVSDFVVFVFVGADEADCSAIHRSLGSLRAVKDPQRWKFVATDCFVAVIVVFGDQLFEAGNRRSEGRFAHLVPGGNDDFIACQDRSAGCGCCAFSDPDLTSVRNVQRLH